MKKLFFKNSFSFCLLVFALFIIGAGCNPNNNDPTNSSSNGISYLLDGNLVSFDNAQVTA